MPVHTFTNLSDPLAINGTLAFGINAAGDIVGFYGTGTSLNGFLLSGGTYTTIDDPLGSNGSRATGINNAGQIVGLYDVGGHEHGFLLSGGTYTTIDDPLAGTTATQASGINDRGQIVGTYVNASGDHGFLLSGGVYAMTGPTAAAPWQALIGSLEGTVEELIFRGAIFRLFWSALGVWWAFGLSSALFGAAHLIKPSADLMAVLGIIFAGGIPMAALYLLTSRLWASIGYHIAWNFTEAYVFGAQVSGTGSGPSLYHVRPAAGVDTLWSGVPSGRKHQ